jgi:hypothetical protein
MHTDPSDEGNRKLPTLLLALLIVFAAIICLGGCLVASCTAVALLGTPTENTFKDVGKRVPGVPSR